MHLKKDINQWVFPLWRHKGLFHRKEGINKLVQGTLYELYTSGKKKVRFFFFFFFFCLVGFGSIRQNSQCSTRKTEEFFCILKTYLKFPPSPVLCALLQMLFSLTFAGGSCSVWSLTCFACCDDNFRSGAEISCFETEGHWQLEKRKKFKVFWGINPLFLRFFPILFF